MVLRSPVCSVVGHVDHGKSSLLDFIRSSNIVSKEAGAITQAIGASIVPVEVIKNLCGALLKTMNRDITLPGLLFIDTPGHAAFTSLRKRGGNLADIAVVVIDVNEGVMPQTEESIKILISYKTPFIIALNKIDLIQGFKQNQSCSLIQNINQQESNIQTIVDKKLYDVVGKIHELFSLSSDRFDRVSDYTKQITIIPCSAKTGLGIPELLMTLLGLAQKYLGDKLIIELNDNAKGTILEVKDEKGLGITMDAIIYDGNLKIGDTIVLGTMNEPIVTKVKALFEPNPLAEMMDKKSKFKSVKSVYAATGVKISAKDIENVVAGMPLRSASNNDIEKIKNEILKEVKEVLIETDIEGVICKADSLGSLEAMIKLLKENNISIRKASVGNIVRKDIIDAESSLENDPLNSVVLGFNVKAETSDTIKIITGNIIYKILDDLVEWQKKKRNDIKIKEIDNLSKPAKIEILSGYIFRQNNPAVVGSEVLMGELKVGSDLMKEGIVITSVKQIQSENKAISVAEKGKRIALSMNNVTIGRQVCENDILYVALTENEFRKYKEFKDYLDGDTKSLLKEIADIMRRKNPVWGV
jgi:translation initiation factor 5B